MGVLLWSAFDCWVACGWFNYVFLSTLVLEFLFSCDRPVALMLTGDFVVRLFCLLGCILLVVWVLIAILSLLGLACHSCWIGCAPLEFAGRVYFVTLVGWCDML